MKKKLFIVGVLAASIAVSALSAVGCSKPEELVEELPDTFVNQTLDFELTEDTGMPTPSVSSSRGEKIENLIVKYGASYENDEYLKEDVVLFRQWQYEKLYNDLVQKAKDNPRYLNTYRLQAEVYLIKSQYQAALAALDKVLYYNHDDVYALGLSAYVQNIQGNTAQRDARLKALKNVSPKCHDDLYGLMVKATAWLNAEHGTEKLNSTDPLPYDAIGILGVAPSSTGQLQGSGPSRVKAAYKAAYYCDEDVKLIPSGGAIDTDYSEAGVMGNYLIRNSKAIAESLELDPSKYTVYGDNVLLDEEARDTIGNAIGICNIMVENDLHNLLIIASEDQVARAEVIFNAYIDANNLDITLASHSSGGTTPTSGQLKYAYVGAASAYGLFTKDDYANHSKFVIETTNALTMPKGVVKLDKTSAKNGETITYSVVAASGYEVDTVSVKTSSGENVAVSNGTFTMPKESVMISATFKPIAGSVTLSFFNAANFGTSENGIVDIADALQACENDIKMVTDGIDSVIDNIAADPLITAKNALGYGKMGGFGVAAGGRIGGFKLQFKEDYKISKIQVTAVKYSATEGHLQVNGIDPTSGTLQGEANVFDASYVEYAFDTPTNVLDIRTVAETVEGTTNYGRVIIYSITLFFEDATKANDVYSINIGDVQHGKVTTNALEAREGATVTLTTEGEKGYFIDTLKVMNGETEVTVTGNTFVMPAGNVTVSATFVQRLLAETNIEVSGDKTYNSQIVGAVSTDKAFYSSGDTATINVKAGAGFEVETLTVKTVSGKTVTVNNDNTFAFPNENVVITATYKVKAGTTTLDLLKPEYLGTKSYTSYTAADIESGYENRINAMYGENFVDVSNVDACGIDKFGGWGIASGKKAGSFTLTFAEDKKISKIIVNAAKNANGEGQLIVNGTDMGSQTFSVINAGEGGQLDIDSNVEFTFDTATNTLAFVGANATGGGRTIIYSITIVWAED